MGELKRVLGYKTILLITINSIIGSGLFILPALGAKISGPSTILALIFLSLVSIYLSMCFAELVGMFPKSGGIYEFSKKAYGTFTSFLLGWTSWLICNITTAMLIIGAISYLIPFGGNILIGGILIKSKILKLFLCIIWILIFNYMTFKGVKSSAFMLISFSIITLSLILFIIIPSLSQLHISNLTPFFIHPKLFDNFSAILMTVFVVSETFFGIEAICFLAEETKNPEKVLPKALVHATIIISIIVITFVTITFLTMPASTFSLFNAPYINYSNLIIGEWAGKIVAIGIYLIILGAAASWIVTGPRLILSLAKDRVFIKSLSEIHPKHNTPYKAIIFQTIVTILLVIISSGESGYEMLVKILTPLVILLMSFVVIIVPILRVKLPEHNRPYKVKAPLFGPILLIFFYFFLIITWIKIDQHIALNLLKIGLSLITLGVPVFFLLMLYYNPDAIRKISDGLAKLRILTEGIELPKSIRKEILSLVGDLNGKNILEHGCSIGTLTLELAEKVGPNGKIYATNISKGEIDILQTRLNKNEIINVSAIHDLHHSSRIHPDVPKIDMFVSFGSFGYTQDISKISNEIYKRLPMGGKIIIVEYIDLYKILPNAGWLRQLEEVEKIFRKNGFLIRIIRKKGIFWNYLFIYGVKASKNSLPYI